VNDEELEKFARDLGELSPRGPSPRLRARLDALVDARAGDRPRSRIAEVGARSPRWSRLAPWLAMAAGIAFAVLVLWWHPFAGERGGRAADPEASGEVAAHPLAPSAGENGGEDSAFRPVIARNSLRNRIDEGLVTLQGGLSARQYRFQFVDTVVWENARDGSRFEVSTPREEIVLVPVHTF
jgi:hypothetical protein